MKRFILADYSTNELSQGTKILTEYSTEGQLLALNAYKMPLKEQTIDIALCVRVIHHLQTPSLFFDEVFRILRPHGVFILEVANKRNARALLKALFKGKLFDYLKEPITKVEHKTDQSQGLKEGQVSLIYAFDIAYIRKLLERVGFMIKGQYACSFFRLPLLKKLLPLSFLLLLEAIFQRFLSFSLLAPSVFLVSEKRGDFTEDPRSFVELLACPACKSSAIARKEGAYLCSSCGRIFAQKKEGIQDLRDPVPEEITF